MPKLNMPKLQWFGLGLGFLCSGLMLSAPVQAQPGGTLSDPSGIGLFQSSSSGFGSFSSVSLGGQASILQTVMQMADALLNPDTPANLVASNKAIVDIPEEVSPETRASLQAFRSYLDIVSKQSWRDTRTFDRHLQTISTNLLKDVEVANATCQSQGGAACVRLNSLLGKTDQLLNAIDTLEAELISRVPKARTF